MDARSIIRRLEGFMPVVDALIVGIDDTDARWKPPSGAWSILEIICHLVDEETEDFGARVRSILEDPSRAWAPIEPSAWAVDRAYNQRDLRTEFTRLRAARAATLAWLVPLGASDWSKTHNRQEFGGPVRAGDLLASWAAHDLLHIRQLTKRRYELLGQDAEPFSTRYAGNWGA